MRTNILIVAFLIGLVGCKFENEDIILTSLRDYYDSSTIQMAIMGYVTPDGATKFYSFGPAIIGQSGNVDEDNIFRIASMTKPITSVAALQLVEKGLIGLDDPLIDLLPEMSSIPILDKNGNLKASNEKITLRQLLTHTSGFAYDFTSTKLANFVIDSTWVYKDNPRIFESGTSFRYGTSTYWVGKLVEKISNTDLENYLRKNITGPLQMNYTWFNVPDSLKYKIVSWGTKDSLGNYVEYERLPAEEVTDFEGDGGLYSSPNDYLKFLHCILNYGKYEGGRILKKETVEMMLKDQLPSDISIIWEGYSDDAPKYIKDFVDISDGWCFIGDYEKNPNEDVRAEGAVWWGGIHNTYFTLDVKNNIALVFMSQIFPTVDKERFEFYRLFEKEIYQTIK
ncbi:serine hydrolase [Prolixibacteraceae bacterium Z1-6]|uniref:Serine hydrolase n=1 Tax=Draconibacterium aestuarii TaxID=2998507 RepID=A0A9X3F577_9BACT|nr:serine hydrolase [Prolixibacteraceae bacterium Z1-6]